MKHQLLRFSIYSVVIYYLLRFKIYTSPTEVQYKYISPTEAQYNVLCSRVMYHLLRFSIYSMVMYHLLRFSIQCSHENILKAHTRIAWEQG